MNRLCVTLCALLLISADMGCRKSDAPGETSGTNEAMQQKVIQWLDKQQTPGQPHRVALTKAIKENLQWNHAWEGARDKDEQLLMIPLAGGLKLRNNSKLETKNYLLLFTDLQGNILAGHIFQSIGSSRFTKNTIPSYYNISGRYPNEGLNGTYCTMNIHDIYYSQKVYENNRLKESSMHQTKQNGNSRTNSNCVDWYNVTTYYNTETGEVLYQTETYLGTTCSGCVPYTGTPQTTLTAETEWDCNVGSGGGGGEDGEETGVRDKEWIVMAAPGSGPNSLSGIYSIERFKGRRLASEPQGGFFKWISHPGPSTCSFCSSSQPYNVWVEESNSVWLSSPQTANSRVKGHLNFNYITYPADKIKAFQFIDVF